MNNSMSEFVRQNITNQGINSGSKIGKIIGYIILALFIGFLIFAIIYANEKLKKNQNETTGGKSADDRVNLGLEVYKNYFNMNQLPIPENGTYFNTFYK